MKVILTPNRTLGYSNWVNLTILVSVCQLFWFSGWSLPTWWLPGRRGGWAHWWAGREEYRLQTCTGEGGEREIWVNLEQFLGPTFHVASVPDLHSAFCPLQQREAALFYAASDKEQGGGTWAKDLSYKFTWFSEIGEGKGKNMGGRWRRKRKKK